MKVTRPLLLLFSIFAISHSSIAQTSKTKRPNIIVIMADDMGYGDPGCYGQQKIKTPAIDRMAKEGMKFTQFYCGTAVCAPSRSSFITGQHTGHTPVRGNKPAGPEGQWPLPDSTITIATVLKKQGYTNGAFGKWGLGAPGSTGDPLKQGFDHFFGYYNQTTAHNYYPVQMWDDDKRINFPENANGNEGTYSGDLIHHAALSFIDKNAASPFFLFLAYTLPHAALQVPKDSVYLNYVKLFNEQPAPKVKESKNEGLAYQEYPHAAYAAMVTRFDKYLGDVIQRLKKLGIDKNTLVLFCSDNGPHKEGQNDPEFFKSSGGLRGIKRDLYEGGIRTPFIARWPGRIKSGTTNDFIGAFWDLFPTFASLAGADLKTMTQLDGISILPKLLNQNNQQQHQFLYWEFHEQDGKQAIRMGKWKGIKLSVNKNINAPLELYDLEKDLGETNNIAPQFPLIVQQLNSFIKQSHKETIDWPLLSSDSSK